MSVIVDSNIQRTVPTVVVSDTKSDHNETRDHDKKKTPFSFLRAITTFFMDFLETIVVALSIFVVVYLFLVQPHEVKGSSMEPTFHNNEYILTDKLSYRFRDPQRGDVVIFKAPRNSDVDYIKRIIAVGGEKVKVVDGSVYVDGSRLGEPYLESETFLFPGSFLQEGAEITVPYGDYFVMGDNRSHSSDSREFGPVERKLIIGRAFMRYWPPTVFGPIQHVTYAEDK